jgi:hypothetical protein
MANLEARMNRLDRKHLRWVAESCDWYLARQTGLSRTISDLEALIGELDRPENKELVARIQGNWGVLEDLYSVDVVYPHRRVLLEHQGQLDQAARNMKALATDALDRAGYGLQPGDDEDEEGDD